MTSIPRELGELADLMGVETSYENVHKQRQHASVESLLAVLRGLGAGIGSVADAPRAIQEHRQERARRGIEPVIVAWNGVATKFGLALPAAVAGRGISCTVRSEAGDVSHPVLRAEVVEPGRLSAATCPPGFAFINLLTPVGLEPGYHHLALETAAGTFDTCVISAPMRAGGLRGSATTAKAQRAGGTPSPPVPRSWGCFVPLYAVRSPRNWGAGDFTDLADLSRWVHSLGGRFFGTLPLLAAFLDEPYEPSPYAPASRMFWNEFYIDVERVPELPDCAAARDLVAGAQFQRTLSALRHRGEVDYRQIMALKRQVLSVLAADFFARRPPRFADLHEFTQRHPRVHDYAAFRAACERLRQPWQQWPVALRDGQLTPADYEQAIADYHCYVQWIAGQQLGRLAAEASATGDGLYLDLPLGVRSDSYDVWRNRHAYVDGTMAGAPPDAFFTKGQNWNFPPLHPEGIRHQGYQHFRDYLGHSLQLASTLRIDHVMGLHRLYWIPAGLPASEGVYVRYRSEELYAVLCLESQRHESTIIGENLGTVPPQVNDSLQRHGIRRMFVVQYELCAPDRQPLARVPHACIASLNTHDMPTFAAWWRGTDIAARQQLDLLSEPEAGRERRRLADTKSEFASWLCAHDWLHGNPQDETAILAAILACLAASPAEAVLVNLEDLWLETQPQNVPGTGPELPNWKRKAAVPFPQFTRDPALLAVLHSVARWRQRAATVATSASPETTRERQSG